MKILKKLYIAFAFVLAIGLPVFFMGCNTTKEPTIEITTEFKTTYYVGEDLDVTGGILTYTDENGKETYVAVEADMLTGFSSATAGTREMVLTYDDLTILVRYTIIEKPGVVSEKLYYCKDTDRISDIEVDCYLYIYFNNDASTLHMVISYNEPADVYANLDTGVKVEETKCTYTKSTVDGDVVYSVTTSTNEIITIKAKTAKSINAYGVSDGTTMNYDLVIYEPAQ